MKLIDVDALGEKIEALMQKYMAAGIVKVARDYNFVLTVIDSTPTVDAVEVIRCKNCKWYVEDREFPPFCDNPICGMQHPNDETFCSYGERRDDDGRRFD